MSLSSERCDAERLSLVVVRENPKLLLKPVMQAHELGFPCFMCELLALLVCFLCATVDLLINVVA